MATAAANKVVKIILPDPEPTEADKIWALLGKDPFKDCAIFLNRILVVKWQRTMLSKSILAPGQTRKEDLYQGKTGLVVYVGPAAFVEDAQSGKFYGATVKVGDWAFYRASDGIDMDFVPANGGEKVHCRCLVDGEIIGRVPRPDFFY